MGNVSYEAAMAAAKIAFCWNSTDGSLEAFQKDLANVLIDIPEYQILKKAREIGHATDNDERTYISSHRTAGRLATML